MGEHSRVATRYCVDQFYSHMPSSLPSSLLFCGLDPVHIEVSCRDATKSHEYRPRAVSAPYCCPYQFSPQKKQAPYRRISTLSTSRFYVQLHQGCRVVSVCLESLYMLQKVHRCICWQLISRAQIARSR